VAPSASKSIYQKEENNNNNKNKIKKERQKKNRRVKSGKDAGKEIKIEYKKGKGNVKIENLYTQ